MKYIVFFLAVVALVSADEKKPVEEKKQDDKPRQDDKRGLQWPLPDHTSEGDLMLHGAISYDRVRALHKAKVEDEVDKMVLAHGRTFLRRVSKFLDDNEGKDFKIMPILCRDTRNLNATSNRWKIEIAKEPKQNDSTIQKDSPLPKEKADDQPRANNATSNETETTTVLPSSDRPASTAAPLASTDRPTDKPADKATTAKPVDDKEKEDSYEVRRRDFYRQMGSNFARLLMREHRKEELKEDEKEYLKHWIDDEAVHYGAMSIFCNEGENVKEIKKQLTIFLDDKPQ